MISDLQALFSSTRLMNISEVLLALCATFLLSSMLTTVYRWTHHGLAYSRTFMHAMVLGSITSSIMIMVIGNNLARGLGILGALAIIRFRTPVRDPRDMVFLFCSLATGIGCGARVFSVSVAGALFFCATALYLHWAPFSSKAPYEGLLRFLLPADSDAHPRLQEIFSKYTSAVTLVSVREAVQGGFLEYAYQTTLLHSDQQHAMMNDLSAIEDIEEPSILMQRSTVEL